MQKEVGHWYFDKEVGHWYLVIGSHFTLMGKFWGGGRGEDKLKEIG